MGVVRVIAILLRVFLIPRAALARCGVVIGFSEGGSTTTKRVKMGENATICENGGDC